MRKLRYMQQPLLIIITGVPGAGKTTLGKKLAQMLRLPFIHKDGIKEVLFDKLGNNLSNETKTVQSLSYDLLYCFLASCLRAGNSLIIESNFMDNFDTPKIKALQKEFDFQIFQILCVVDEKIAFNRFSARAGTNERHPGHNDHQKLEEFKQALVEGRKYKLNLGHVYEQNMNDFAIIDYDKLIANIKEKIV